MPKTTAAAKVIEDIDPRTLVMAANARTDPRLDQDFLASIKEHGVLQPIIATRTPAGEVRIRFGQRRALAAIDAGHAYVPVVIIADERDGTPGEIDRLLEQFAENEHRTGLTAGEKAQVVADLLDLGLTTGQVQRRTRLAKTDVAAAQRVAKSETATQATARHEFLTLDTAAAVAEFDSDPDAVKGLVEAAKDGQGEFAHTLQQLRDDRDEREAIAGRRAELEAEGFTVTGKRLSYEQRVEFLAGPGGTRFTEEAHRGCGGHVAALDTRPLYDDPDGRTFHVVAIWYCLDPKAHGHKSVTGSSSASSGQDPEERRLVIAGNNAWRSAETVRRQWLRTFLARKTPPDGGLRFTLEAVARMDYAVQPGLTGGHQLACDLLGLNEQAAENGTPLPQVALAAMTGATDSRAQVIALGLVLGAYEASTNVQTWRVPSGSANWRGGLGAETSLYLKALAGWGYGLSGIEQVVADGKPYVPDTDAKGESR